MRLRTCLLAVALVASGCGSAGSGIDPSGKIIAIGAENEYANVISQVGSRYVDVTAIQSNPNSDPHTFEASPSVANEISSAGLIVQNGLGYDSYMSTIEAASANSSRKVIVVQKLLGLPDSTPNPHLWYRPGTMTAVAAAVASDLAAIQPQHAAYFHANAAAFERSLTPWYRTLAQFKARYPGTTVATTEPVGDYMLAAAGAANLTPFSMQADVMNGVDPAPQDVGLENQLLSQHKVKVFLYNEQVTDSLTQSFLSAANKGGIPVVALYETMPTGYDYQQWMLAEVEALTRAVAQHASTQRL